ncbi:YIP1 family protein [Methanoplanus sp. FWC-SCC4]|uniref:YIP1 family protein n=1 Tax=Methanochimaera problematica TaxID=2609417 RepID=A0AA97FB68_9EURY|nr:Yip1 family protein [Methanoplanus sp. FWC-SCC4]WOF15347.1 YIP1 family protein [Methanoplanus sp. FWC-SCC4]
MLSDIYQKFKGIILNPIETFQSCHDEPLKTTIPYFIAIISVFSCLSGIVNMFIVGVISFFYPGMNLELIVIISLLTGLFSILYSIITAVIGLIVISLIFHVCIYILGGRKGIEKTIKATIYSFTPFALIGWIPLVNIVAWIWLFVLEVIALREFHGVSTKRALLAVLIPVMLLIVVILLAILAYFIIIKTGSVMVV